MVGPRVYHLKHARSYPAFTAQDPAKVMDLANQWLKRHDFHVKAKSKQHSLGKKRGIHVNFVPKFKLFIEQGVNGHYVVRFDYYAKIKLGTAVVVGVVTSGISTVIGVGTLAITLADADHFVDKFWKHIDSLARGAPVILTVERWASDGKGNFVKQAAPHPPTVVAHPSQAGKAYTTGPPPPQQAHTTGPMYHGQPVPHAPPNQARVLPAPAPQQAYAQPPPPQQAYAPPPPPPPPVPQQPQVHLPMYYAPPQPPPVPQQTAPPTMQPGQVYGHNALRQTQTMMPSAPPMNAPPPPPPAHGYPHVDSASSYAGSPLHSNYAPSQSSAYPPAQAQNQHYPPSVQSYSSSHSYQQPQQHQQPPSSYPSPAHHNFPPPPTPQQQQSIYPPPPTPPTHQQNTYPSAPNFNYPPAPPSLAGSQGRNDAASTASYYDKQPPRGTQMSQQGNRQSQQFDRQSQYDIKSFHGDYKSNAGGAPGDMQSYYDFNHADTQSLKKSNETFNPWESNAIAESRKESLGSTTGSNLYPPLPPKRRTTSGTPSH